MIVDVVEVVKERVFVVKEMVLVNIGGRRELFFIKVGDVVSNVF